MHSAAGRCSLRHVLIVCGALFAAAVAIGAQAPSTPREPTPVVLLRPQRVFDAASDQAHPGWVVLVSGNKIAASGRPVMCARPPVRAPSSLPARPSSPGSSTHTHTSSCTPTTKRCGTIRC